jgi:hypothetical protein
VTNATQSNITGVGTLTSLSTTGNVTVNRLLPNGIEYTRYGYANVVTSGGTTNIGGAINDAKRTYIFTGSSNQTVGLPLYNNSSAFVAEYYIVNASTGTLSVQDVVGFPLTNIPPGASATITSNNQQAVGTSNWAVSYYASGYALGCGGQTWQDVSASRSFNTNYTNSTGRPIMVSVLSWFGVNQSMSLLVSGISVSQGGWSSFAYGYVSATVSAVVPPGQTYQVSSGGTSLALSWSELR